MLDRSCWPGGARVQSWWVFKRYMCLSTSLALDLHLGRVTEDQSLCCSQSGVEILQNDETSTEEKIVTGESVLEVWPR